MATHSFEGFHGSSKANCDDIIKQQHVRPSLGDDHWLGDGGYFFVEGLGDPKSHAKEWAIAEAWNNIAKKNDYTSYGVIGELIEVDDDFLLDLTTNDGLNLLNYIKEKFIEKLRRTRLKLANQFLEGKLINFARNEGLIEVKVAKGNFYIKFVLERKLRFNLRTPNCTICAVYNEDVIRNIELVEEGDVA